MTKDTICNWLGCNSVHTCHIYKSVFSTSHLTSKQVEYYDGRYCEKHLANFLVYDDDDNLQI